MNNKNKIIVSIIVLVLIAIVGYNYLNNNIINETKNNLKVGVVPIAVALPLYVAIDEGYFEDEGFNPELVTLGSSNELANALTSGQLDIAVIATNTMLDVSYVSQKKPKLVITNPYSNTPGNITDYLLVKDLTKISKIEDLVGMKIGIFPGSVIKVFCQLIFEKHGLSKDDYQLIELSPKDWAVALEFNQIDALSALEPSASQMIKDGIAVPIVSGLYAELMPDVPLSGHWIGADFIDNNDEETIEKIIKVINKAVKLINENPAKARKYLVKYANVREDVVDNVQLNKWVTHNEQDAASIQQFVDILFDNGALQDKADIKSYLNKK